jgi:hypothetical protein
MKLKLLTIISILMLLAALTRAADLPFPPEASGEYFRAKELSVEGFGGLNTSDFDHERSYVGVGVNYFLTDELGVAVQTSFPNVGGLFFENIAARGIYRAIFNQNALYGYVGPQWLIKDDDWAGELGVGLERRWTRHWGTYAEVGIWKGLTGHNRDASATGRVGVRWAF